MKWKMEMRRGEADASAVVALLVICIGLLIGGPMWGLPKYGVWRANLAGQAELVRAEQNRKIKIEEAKADLEASRMNAEAELERAKGSAKAEVERAKGAAEAIGIENGKLTDTYIKYLWVRQQGQCNNSVIYIPTEAGLPVLEAGRRP